METTNKINSFEDLIVWQQAVDLSVMVYKISSRFPKEEVFSLTNQIRRASNSVSLNISEGSVRTTRSFINHLKIANGSAAEVLSAAILASKLGYIVADDIKELRPAIAGVTKMLNKLISSLEEKVKHSLAVAPTTSH